MNEEQSFLVSKLKCAVENVYREERFLLTYSEGDREGLEQAFVFRVGIQLSNLLRETTYASLDLDSEYNKNHGNTKTSIRFQNGLRPDLIIHQRDSNKKNMLVAEFKGWWNNNIEDDLKKLEDLTNPNDNYHYLIGVFVKIGQTEATYRYFINGSEHE
ncbi:hypothetical protein ACFSQD_14025 [Flavihumibacter stibioxidans]|uniref:PD-(D/E)XK nuclease superfamily protein n=1 Tax=Flavihumibacter stibioxidans TaxID=1834163 RepID=A0ABR7M8W0_9BACT|nr:hypothetical protein [Flavihumibacter stibioxidans]MBC6491279.1 hypothetical protein [Flavihumibacter stibioxidans]